MANNIGWGKINEISWFGDANASNGWGADYPFDADGSFFTTDTTLIKSDTNQYTGDQTKY